MRLPLFLDLTGRQALVVGGGPVAVRRSRTLLAAGADVVVVAPRVAAGLDDRVAVRWRRFAPDDLDGVDLVLACTDDPRVNTEVAAAAASRHLWCVRADDAAQSAAWWPATGMVDAIQVAVSAGGDPSRARDLRDSAVRALHAGEWHARPARRRGGRVVLVGGGPGDPGLLTLRGYRALLDADVVVADRLAPQDLLGTLPPEVDVVDAGKTPRGPGMTQDEINAVLVERASAGAAVVRLKGGDPFVLGRGAEEVAACTAAGLPVEVIPGVSSVTAAPTLAGIPLTRRGTAQEFTVVSGHLPPGDAGSTVDWAALASGQGTLVLLMAVHHLDAIATALVSGGRPAATPVAVIERASLADQRVVRATLRDLAATSRAAGVAPPAVVVVGAVVADLDLSAPPDPGAAAVRP